VIVNDQSTLSYVVIYGTAAMLEDATEIQDRLIRRYLGDIEAERRRDHLEPDRVIIEVTPDRILTGR
jgi:hypothetical protein